MHFSRTDCDVFLYELDLSNVLKKLFKSEYYKDKSQTCNYKIRRLWRYANGAL